VERRSNASETDLSACTVFLIPALDPDSTLQNLILDLRLCFPDAPILVVNDGSLNEPQGLFDTLGNIRGVQVLHHSQNLGKGAALKRGIGVALRHFPHLSGIVTLDADGQHKVCDIERVYRRISTHPHELVLGVRSFGPGVPLRSRLGNRLTSAVFELVSGNPVKDTQTGLRGISRQLAQRCLSLSTSRYEFEFDMLLTASKTGTPLHQIPIETIYIDGNAGSHFNPILDSLRIYFVLLRFLASSLVVAALDIVLFGALYSSTGNILVSVAAGRITIGVLNFTVNRQFVFRSRRPIVFEAVTYAANLTLMGGLCVAWIELLISMHFNPFLAKAVSECSLFFLNFYFQRTAVFKRNVGTHQCSDLETYSPGV
jgi:putative flippase GtrA